MKTTRSRILLGAVLCFIVLGVFPASADVVGWWRFNGDGTNVPNVSNPGTLDGTIVSISNDNSSAVVDIGDIEFGSVASKMPSVTERLQGIAPRVYDPLAGLVHDGGKTLSWEEGFVQGGMMVPYSDALALTTFTVQAMIRLPENADSRGTGYGSSLFPIAQFGKDQTEGWIFGVYEGYLFSRFTYTNTSDETAQKAVPGYYFTASGFPSLYDGKWHHVAMAFTTAGANAVCRMFVDGVQCAENRATNWKSWNYSGSLPLFIGANPFTYARTFYGDIAEVRITNDATSKDQSNNFLVPLLDGQGLADADTALLLTFDDATIGFPTNMTIATKETSGTSDTHGNKAYVWYAMNNGILNAAYENPTIPHWLAFATKGEAEHLVSDLWPTNSAETAGALVECASGAMTNAVIESGSLSIPTYQRVVNSNTRSISNLIQLDDGACYFSTNSFTAECFFKTSIANGVTDTIFYAPFMKLCVYQGKLLLRGYKNGTEGGIGDIKGAEAVNDGEWHHVACVYDASTTTFTLWQDGEVVGSKTGTALYSDGYATKSGITTLGFLIGGQRFGLDSDVQGFEGSLDMVRITRRALAQGEFLQAKALPEPLFFATFDNDTAASFATGLPDYLAPAGSGATMEGGAAAPALVTSHAGFWRADSDARNKEFGNALSLDGGYVLWPRNRLLERRSFTLEFFGKFPYLANSATFARLNIGTDVGAPVWALFNSVDSKGIHRLMVAMSVTSDGGVTYSRANKYLYNFDTHVGEWERWHHWALTIASSGGQTVATLYKDGTRVGSESATGELYLPPEGTCFSFGASIDASGYMQGVFDCVRISDGVLAPSEFMKYDPAPFMLIVR